MHFQVEKRIEAPPEEVWRWLVDTERMKDWMPELVGTDRKGDLGADGMAFIMTLREAGKLVSYEGTITKWEPARLLGMQFTGGSLMKGQEMLVDYVLASRGAETILKHAFAVKTRGVLQFLEPIMEPLAKRPALKHLSQIKACVEAGAKAQGAAGKGAPPA